MAHSRQVNQLRREGRISEALNMARELINCDNQSIWNIRAYGWSLHDAVAEAVREHPETAAELIREFSSLDIPAEEKVLAARQEYFSTITPQALPLMTEAEEKSKKGLHDEALKLYRRALDAAPHSNAARKGLGWEIWRSLIRMDRENADASTVNELLREYMNLTDPPTPGKLHSLILDAASKLASAFPDYIRFVKWWNLENMRSRDFEKQKCAKTGKTYDSLAERVIKGLHRAGKNRGAPEDFQWISRFIGDHYKKYPDQEWFAYYYGVSLIKAGNTEQAREIILPVVSCKSGEFWAWDLLADTCTDPAEKKACLCKSLLCRVKSDSFRVKVHCRLGELLRNEGSLSQAKQEYLTALSLREKQGWKIPADLNRITHEEWFRNTEPSNSNRELYSNHAASAQEIIIRDLPCAEGIVTHINKKKGVVRAALSRTDSCLLYTDRLPEAARLDIGTFIRVKAAAGSRSGRRTAVWFEPIDRKPETADFLKTFSGKIRIRDGNAFGFVGDCYISPGLIRRNQLNSNDKVTGMKIQEWNQQKNKNTWSAVTVRRKDTE